MNSVTFNNPYLLLIGIPMMLFVAVAFFLIIKKRGFNFHNLTSLAIHAVIVVLITLSVGGTSFTHYASDTQICVLADVSESASGYADEIDSYVNQIKDQSKGMAEVAVVSFAKDYKLVSNFGSSFVTVNTNSVNKSATDIANALEYAGTLFREDKMKRIVLITDAKETDNSAESVARTLKRDGVRIDAIYLGGEENTALEVQINGVEANESAYFNKSEKAKITLQSNYVATFTVELRLNGATYASTEFTTSAGIDYVTFDLSTTTAGKKEYEVVINPQYDHYSENNKYYFTQNVLDNLKILVISGSTADENAAKTVYSGFSDTTYIRDKTSFPNTLDYLCSFDEIVFANADLIKISNVGTFIKNLQTAVVDYGKNVNVLGMDKTYPEGSIFNDYLNMLPVNFDIQASSTGLVIVIDASLSMQNNNRLPMAKAGAIQCLDLLDSDDFISVIRFSSNTSVVVPLTRVIDRDAIKAKINSITSTQGTNMTTALNAAYKQLDGLNFDTKKVILISDGMPTDSNQKAAVEKLLAAGVTTSVINIQSSEGVSFLKGLAAAGNGNYFYVSNTSDLPQIMVNEANTNVSSPVIEQNCSMIFNKPNDAHLSNVTELPNVNGFVYTIAKYSATSVLTTKFLNTETNVIKEAPIFSYWSYGKGRVSIFLTSLATSWASHWLSNENGDRFLKNYTALSIPTRINRTPYIITTKQNGHSLTFMMQYEDMDRAIKMSKITLTSPSGKMIDSNFSLVDGYYQTTFETTETGTYYYQINYSNKNDSYLYSLDYYFSRSYSSEYNFFDTSDEYLLHTVVSEDSVVTNDVTKFLDESMEFELTTSELSMPMLVIALVLFIVDIGIRKLKLVDIRDFFKGSKSNAASNA